MARLVILGGSMDGLLAGYLASERFAGLDVVILESGVPAGEFLAAGANYLRASAETTWILERLGIVAAEHTVSGGALIHGKVESFPHVLRAVGKPRAAAIQADHYRKTRQMEPPTGPCKALNDEHSLARRALRCNWEKAVEWMGHRIAIWRKDAVQLQPGRVLLSDGVWLPFDWLITTLPVWKMRPLVWFSLPPTRVCKLNLIQVESRRDPYARWDYVFTPYTPHNSIFRVSSREGDHICEFAGDWDGQLRTDLVSDLNFLFPDLWYAKAYAKGLDGWPIPIPEAVEWPNNVQPLGRHATYNPRISVDSAPERLLELARKWGWK